jgi:DNA-binding transcriptional LysR family regulator
MMNLQQLKYFLTTVELGSLNKAAKALYISQPALTKQLARLERDLGCRLLIRKTTGIELTDAGGYLYEKACSILQQVQQTVEGMKQYAQTPQLRIGALPSLASYYLSGFIHKLEDSKEFRVDITILDTTRELISMMEEDRLDLAFVQDFAGHDRFHTIHLFIDPYVAILPASHPLVRETPLSFQRLVKEKMVIYKDPCDIRTSFRRHCNELGIEPSTVLELDFNDSILTFVSKGYGVSFVPSLVAEHMYDPSIVVREIEIDSFSRTVDVVFQSKFEPYIHQLLHSTVHEE